MSLMTKMRKVANPGQAAPGGDADFEQTLAQLTSMDVRDRAQTLIDYQIGFQLLDRDRKDNTADGVAVFRINDEWLLVPAIYRKGSIKGTNTLYMMEKDKIVPCTEAMVQKIINAPGKSMGRSVLRNQPKDNLTPSPDFSALVEPRANKLGSDGMLKVARLSQDMQKKARSFLEEYKKEPKKVEIRVKQAILDMGKEAVEILTPLFRQVPELLVHFNKHHSMDTLRKAAAINPRVDPVRQPKSVLPKTASMEKSGGVYIRSFFKSQILPASADPFEYISPRGVMFKDSREEEATGKVFEQSIQQSGVQTPTMTGIYDVVGTGGEMTKCLVIVGPEGELGRKAFSTVVRLKNPNFVNASKQAILATPIADGLAGLKVLDILEDVAIKADENYDGDYYVIVSPKGIGTCPFRATVDASSPDEKSGTVFKISMADYNDWGNNPGWHENPRPIVAEEDYSQRVEYIRFSDIENGAITRVGKELVIPKGSKVIKAYNSHKRPDGDNPNRNYPSYYNRDSDPDSPPVRLGTFLDVDLALNSSAPNFKIAKVPGGYSMDGGWYSPVAAVSHLVLKHGLRPKTADELLDKADAQGLKRKPLEFRMKSGTSTPTWPTDPGYAANGPYGEVPQILPMDEVSRSYNSVAEGQVGARRQIEPDAMSSIQNAMQTGHEDVIDAGMLGVLLESSKTKSIVDQYKQDLSKAVDRLGRISIHMARVPEVYEDRYGRTDCMKIEEETNNCFDRLGKLVLQFSDNQIGGDDNDQTVSDLSQL